MLLEGFSLDEDSLIESKVFNSFFKENNEINVNFLF